MKVKAVIMRPDRTNDVIVVPKRKIKQDTFRHDEVLYFLHADRFQVTWSRVFWIFKKYYSTYYYRKGDTMPLPVPNFPDIPPSGDSGEELAAIFNPWFYRIIAQHGMEKWQQILFYVTMGIGLVSLYLVYRVHKVMELLEVIAS